MGLRGFSLIAKFLLTIFIARYINLEALGAYGLITSLTILAPVTLGLGVMYCEIRKAVTESYGYIAQTLQHYINFLFLIYAPLLALTIMLSILYQEKSLFFLLLFVVLIEHVNTNLYSLLLNLSKPVLGNLLFFLRASLWIILYIPLAFIYEDFRSLEVILMFWICGGMSAILLFLWDFRNWTTDKVSRPRIKETVLWIKSNFLKSRIIYLDGIANAGATYLDRFVITLFLGLELTGVYVLFWSVYSALSNLIRTGVLQIAKPKFVKAAGTIDKYFTTLLSKTLKETFFVGVLLSVFGGLALYILLPFIDRPLATEWFPLLSTILLAFIVMISSEVYALVFYSLHRDDLTLKVSCVLAVAALLLNLFLIPLIGLWGAGLSLCALSSIAFYIRYKVAKKVLIRDE